MLRKKKTHWLRPQWRPTRRPVLRPRSHCPVSQVRCHTTPPPDLPDPPARLPRPGLKNARAAPPPSAISAPRPPRASLFARLSGISFPVSFRFTRGRARERPARVGAGWICASCTERPMWQVARLPPPLPPSLSLPRPAKLPQRAERGPRPAKLSPPTPKSRGSERGGRKRLVRARARAPRPD